MRVAGQRPRQQADHDHAAKTAQAFTHGEVAHLDADCVDDFLRFANAVGTAAGPVTLDSDFSFVIRATGNIGY